MMKYTLTPERALKLIENLLGPLEIRNKIDDSWKWKWWKLHDDAPQRKVIVWDKDGEAVFTFDRAYNELAISIKHFQKIMSYIPLSSKLLEEILIVLFKNLFNNKFPVEQLQKIDLRRHDKESFEDDEDDN